MTVEQALAGNSGSDLKTLHLEDWLVLVLPPPVSGDPFLQTLHLPVNTVMVRKLQTTPTFMNSPQEGHRVEGGCLWLRHIT